MTKQNGQGNGFSTQAAQDRARQAAQYLRARQLVAQAQLAPLAANARIAAQQGLLGARTWTAPRLESIGQALQEQMAPQVAAALSSAARRIEPPRPRRRRRWPAFVAGAIVFAGGSATAVIIMNRRNSQPAMEAGEPDGTASTSDAAPEMAAADVNGQTQTP
ncbi:MAG TPA: hypothetical protein VGQ26_24185 [Streptosporangiaceae bacterium]|jgi:hypothetical protein|nr:hypothetical protein [Streptosporangiaceae bacterium]